MMTTEEILRILRDFKEKEGDKYGIEQLGLFGSAARGEQTEESDIDVCMTPNALMDYFTLQDIQERLESLFHTKVDVVTLHENMRQLFLNNIRHDAIFI